MGGVIKIGDAMLINGDNVTITKLIPDDTIDLTITSPPYDNLRTYNGFTWDFESLAKELYRVTKPGGVVVWIVGDATVKGSETLTSFRQALFFKDVCGFNLHDTMIWDKGNFTAVGALKYRYAPVFEYMFVLSKGQPKTFNPIKDKPNKWFGDKHHGTIRQADGSTKPLSGLGKPIAEFGQRHNIWTISPEKRATIQHPATFPETLVHDHMISWSNEGDIILDPFMGSGTTGVVALRNKRKFTGIEISEEYMNVAKDRICAASVRAVG